VSHFRTNSNDRNQRNVGSFGKKDVALTKHTIEAADYRQ
jgi:hypothetical protein